MAHDREEAEKSTLLRIEGSWTWLDRIFLMRQLLDQQIDPLFAGLPLPRGSSLLLFNETDAGFGDVSFGIRLLHLLLQAYPDLELTLVSSSPKKQRIFGLPEGVRLFGFGDFDGEDAPQLRPSIVISAPGIFDHCRHGEAVLSRLKLPPETPFLYLAQYGYIRQLRVDAFSPLREAVDARVESFLDEVATREGINPDEMGYRGRSGEVVAAGSNGVRALDHLSSALTENHPRNPLQPWLMSPLSPPRSCGLEEGEIGVHVDPALVAQAAKAGGSPSDRRAKTIAELEDKATQRLLRESGPDAALYMGYSYDSLGVFCALVAAIEAGEAKVERAIDVVLPNARPAAELLPLIFDAPLCERLRRAGIGRVEVAGNPQEGSEGLEVHGLKLGEGPRMRLLTRRPLPNTDYRALLLAAAPVTMVSGDQSFSDAFSADKAIALMEPVYCQTYLLDSLLALAEEIDADLAATMRLGMQHEPDPKALERALSYARRGDLQRAGEALSAQIRAAHDASGPLVWVIARHCWATQHEGIAEQLQTFFSRAWRLHRPEGTLTLPDALLDPLRSEIERLVRTEIEKPVRT